MLYFYLICYSSVIGAAVRLIDLIKNVLEYAMTVCNLTQSELKKSLSYNPENGLFTWVIKKVGVKNGESAGYNRKTNEKEYCFIRLNYRLYRAHRLVWLYVHGFMPEYIDHIDGNGLNNKLVNLRPATSQENNQNVKRRIDNKSGITGVFWFKRTKKWMVYIGTGKHRENIGYFKDKFEAICQRKSAEVRNGYHENHGSIRDFK